MKDRDGTLTEYTYEIDPADKDHYAVGVTVKDTDSKAISTSKYEYINKHKSDGEEWTYKLVTTIDGDRTETTYNECCGLPLIIKRGGEETDVRVRRQRARDPKITPNDVTELAYDPKVSKVERASSAPPRSTRRT